MTKASKQDTAAARKAEDRRKLVRTAAVVHAAFTRKLRQGRLVLLTADGEQRRCGFIRPAISHVLTQVRCGMLTDINPFDLRKGHSAHGKVKGTVTTPNGCGRTSAARGKLHGNRP